MLILFFLSIFSCKTSAPEAPVNKTQNLFTFVVFLLHFSVGIHNFFENVRLCHLHSDGLREVSSVNYFDKIFSLIMFSIIIKIYIWICIKKLKIKLEEDEQHELHEHHESLILRIQKKQRKKQDSTKNINRLSNNNIKMEKQNGLDNNMELWQIVSNNSKNNNMIH